MQEKHEVIKEKDCVCEGTHESRKCRHICSIYR